MKLCISLLVVFVLTYGQSAGQFYENIAVEVGVIHQYNNGFLGGGVSLCDFDNDGLDDISICQRFTNPLFYRNTGNGFEEIPYFISNDKEMKQITWVDFDNDGDKDLFTTSLLAPFKLYKNEGGNLFVDISVAAGFPVTNDYTFGNNWADYDLDGDLDVYISNYNGLGFGNPNVTNLLFRNNGDDTFTDVTLMAGVSGDNCYTFMSLWLDINGDLWPDLYSINDRYECRDYLYTNNGDGTFTDITFTSGAEQYILSMNISADDYDNDGDFDVYITNGTEGCSFYRHDEGDVFVNVAASNGTILNVFCWGTQFIDGDNDMWQDMYVSSTPHIATTGQDRFLYNNHDGTFSNVSNAVGFMGESGWNRSVAAGDVNQDGFADLFTSATLPTYSSLYVAEPNSNQWIKVELEGVVSNRDGISSRIECYAGGIRQSRYTYCGEAYLAQNSSSELFGLAQNELVDSLIVRWPSGIVDKWYNIPSNQNLFLVEGTSRKVMVSTTGGFCAGDSAVLTADEWIHFDWNTGDTTFQLITHESGSFLVQVTDEWSNVFLSDTIIVEQFPLLEYEVIGTSPLCYGDPYGMIQLSMTSWMPDSLIINDSIVDGLAVGNLSPGIYNVSFEDQYGCAYHDVITLTAPELLQATAEVTHPVCFGELGQAVITVSGADNGYIINLGSYDLNALSGGHYEISVINTNECTTYASFDVFEPLPLTAMMHTTDVLCAGEDSGTFSLDSLFGGTGALSVSPNYEGTNLSAGPYEITLTDEVGCQSTMSFEINEPDPLILDVIVAPQYEAGPMGSAEAVIQGGVLPFTYSWEQFPDTVNQLQNLAHGNYMVTVVDSNGCEISSSFTIDFISHVPEVSISSGLIYPNPVTDWFYYQDLDANGWYEILDCTGKSIQTGFLIHTKTRINVDQIASGLYLFHVKKNGKDFSLPLLIYK